MEKEGKKEKRSFLKMMIVCEMRRRKIFYFRLFFFSSVVFLFSSPLSSPFGWPVSDRYGPLIVVGAGPEMGRRGNETRKLFLIPMILLLLTELGKREREGDRKEKGREIGREDVKV